MKPDTSLIAHDWRDIFDSSDLLFQPFDQGRAEYLHHTVVMKGANELSYFHLTNDTLCRVTTDCQAT